jgi:glycosyltransferase involved in cell wall biosynthesis
VRGGDRVTVLAPHAAGLPARWEEQGVEVLTFRYAPARAELLGYGRSLEADERVKGAALAVAPLYALAARRAVARLLARRRFDLFHAHWLVPNAVAAPGRRGTPLAVGLHGSDVFLAERPAVRGFARRTLARAALLTGCSPELVERVCALGFPAERARVIPYGVDAAGFSPGRERGSAWRRRLGVPEAAPMLLGVGRMATKKGFQVLLDAAPAVLGAHQEAHLVLAGGGDLLPRLRAAAARWPERIHFPGPIGRDELPDLFRAADLFVLPAVHDGRGNVDGLPNVILEAMASGLPVVASRVSGIPLAVEDGRTGLLVGEGDREALATALVRLLDDPSRRRAMGEEGRRKVERELTWDAVAARYRAAYAEALAAGGNAGAW